MIFVFITLSIAAIGLLVYLMLYFSSKKVNSQLSYAIIPESKALLVSSGQEATPISFDRYLVSDEWFERLENHLLSSDLVSRINIEIDEDGYLLALILPDFEALRAWWESQGNRWISLDDMLNYTEEENHIALLRRHPEFGAKYRSLISVTNKVIASKTPILSFRLLSKLQWMHIMGEPLPLMYT